MAEHSRDDFSKKAVDLLIFDLDGTLVDSRQDLTDAVNHARRHFGLAALDVQMVSRFVGDGVIKLVERSLPDLPPPQLEAAVSLFREYYRQHAVDHTQAYPGVAQTLQYFQKKKKAIITNKPVAFTRQILARLQLAEHFDMVVGGDTLPVMKPDPAPVLHILEQLQCRPERTVIVGDGTTDMLAGKRATIRTCAVTYGLKDRQALQQTRPDFFVDDIRQLCDLFR